MHSIEALRAGDAPMEYHARREGDKLRQELVSLVEQYFSAGPEILRNDA